MEGGLGREREGEREHTTTEDRREKRPREMKTGRQAEEADGETEKRGEK